MLDALLRRPCSTLNKDTARWVRRQEARSSHQGELNGKEHKHGTGMRQRGLRHLHYLVKLCFQYIQTCLQCRNLTEPMD
ncbi:hypothetical protein DUNSADRAFT_415 [Dunaliella salina]|uniref:Encoded protein n=1 Tax=Dunaliella salina TaxID=3046 RepID=A0ABQ7FZ15_DUNSA|nr:hypothetical protein DUNSADRAFT_415 [Dunaliella salina]|eukprot:KAF5827573.1 hypothetical protein DUNSADRAFT_415 [Dunaliella salina]